ncbi:MAG: hypothetical protein QM651_13705 [Rhodoblastus sp.]
MPKNVRYIEVFRPGTFQPMIGPAVTLTADDLRAIAKTFDPAVGKTPAVVGHPKTDDPAYGWASEFVYDDKTDRLLAGVGDLEPAFEQAVKDKRYHRISLSLFRPDSANNPKPGSWYPKHIGFLGAAAPAVPGLAPVALAADDDQVATFEFGEPALKDVSNLFRKLREWFIAERGQETADNLLPDWTIQWISDAADRDRALPFAAPAAIPPKDDKEKPVSKTDDAAFAAREADLAKREAEIKKREDETRRAGDVAFAEGLIAEGRLMPAAKAKTVELLGVLAGLEGEVSFADDDGKTVKQPAIDAFRDFLKAQPKVVTFGRVDTKAGDPPAASFAAPEGMEVDRDGLDLLAKTEALRRANPKLSFADAYKQAGGQ